MPIAITGVLLRIPGTVFRVDLRPGRRNQLLSKRWAKVLRDEVPIFEPAAQSAGSQHLVMQIIRVGGKPWAPDSHTDDTIDARRDCALIIAGRAEPHATGTYDLATVLVVGGLVLPVVDRRHAEGPEKRGDVPLLGRVLYEYIGGEPIQLRLNRRPVPIRDDLDRTPGIMHGPVIAEHSDNLPEIGV